MILKLHLIFLLSLHSCNVTECYCFTRNMRVTFLFLLVCVAASLAMHIGVKLFYELFLNFCYSYNSNNSRRSQLRIISTNVSKQKYWDLRSMWCKKSKNILEQQSNKQKPSLELSERVRFLCAMPNVVLMMVLVLSEPQIKHATNKQKLCLHFQKGFGSFVQCHM